MTIEDLKIIKAINDTKNITYAARLLFKDESTVSKAIKRIEKELGVKLYYVSHNRPEMTSAGEKAAEIATNALSVIEKLYLLREEKSKTIFSNFFFVGHKLCKIKLTFMRFFKNQPL